MRLESSVAQFLFNQSIRSRVKAHLEPWMFETKIYRSLAGTLVQEVFDFKEIDFSVLMLSVKDKYKTITKEEEEEVLSLYQSFEEPDEEELPFVLSIIEDYIKKKMYSRGLDLISEDKIMEAEEYLTGATNLSLKEKEYLNLSNVSKIEELLDRRFPKDGKYIKSSLGIVNENTVYKGYRRGDLVQVVSPPGVGKSTLLCQEAAVIAHQGFKVGFGILGDNEEDDIALKVCSYYSSMHISEVIEDITPFLEEYKAQVKNINVIAYPAGVCTVRELLSDFKNVKSKEGLDVLIVDYDSNIANAHESMYESGGVIYKALKAFAQVEECVVIVASQPKTEYWDHEIIPLKGANESAKKQHAVDMMLTLNANPECRGIGSLYLAKVRRGTTGLATKLKFDYGKSKIQEVSREEYDILLSNSKRASASKEEEIQL